jgi:hypothetical protein
MPEHPSPALSPRTREERVAEGAVFTQDNVILLKKLNTPYDSIIATGMAVPQLLAVAV